MNMHIIDKNEPKKVSKLSSVSMIIHSICKLEFLHGHFLYDVVADVL